MKTEYLNNPKDVLGLLGSPKIEVYDFNFHGDKFCEAHYKVKGVFRQQNPHTNVVIAAFTTAYARLKLYSVLEKLDPSSILYMDTDSVIHVEREGAYSPLSEIT